MNYAELISGTGSAGSIATWANHAALQTAAPTIVTEAEAFIYRRLRHWQMLTSTSGTMTASGATLTLPADYLEDKAFYFTGTAFGRLKRRTMQEVLSHYSYDGSGNRVYTKPSEYFNDKSNLQFDAPTNTTYPFMLWYYQQPAALGTGTGLTTNFLTGKYPRLMRAACMTQAAEFMKDAGVGSYDRTYWANMTQVELDAAQKESDLNERSADVGAIII